MPKEILLGVFQLCIINFALSTSHLNYTALSKLIKRML